MENTALLAPTQEKKRLTDLIFLAGEIILIASIPTIILALIAANVLMYLSGGSGLLTQ